MNKELNIKYEIKKIIAKKVNNKSNFLKILINNSNFDTIVKKISGDNNVWDNERTKRCSNKL